MMNTVMMMMKLKLRCELQTTTFRYHSSSLTHNKVFLFLEMPEEDNLPHLDPLELSKYFQTLVSD
jgi:hypothetical protein